MTWNSEAYNQFRNERFAPANDLLSLLHPRSLQTVIDLGCGTGEITRCLADLVPGSQIVGVDSSPEMLSSASSLQTALLRFECISIAQQLQRGDTYDLVFSNAALQWIPDHEELLPSIIARLNPGGKLLIQVPAQRHNRANQVLNELAEQSPFRELLAGWQHNSPVLDTGEYARILFERGATSIQVFEKVYPLVLQNSDGVYNWIAGTALIPYLERLPADHNELFKEKLRARLQAAFPQQPAFYPFKRILMSAVF